jgi:hypothetical protein
MARKLTYEIEPMDLANMRANGVRSLGLAECRQIPGHYFLMRLPS